MPFTARPPRPYLPFLLPPQTQTSQPPAAEWPAHMCSPTCTHAFSSVLEGTALGVHPGAGGAGLNPVYV